MASYKPANLFTGECMKISFLFVVLMQLASTISAQAENYSYSCFSYYWNGHDGQRGTMQLSVNPESAQADILEESWDKGLGGMINANYRSRGPVKYVKFGSELILEEVLLIG